MGYYANWSGELVFPKDKQADALKAINALHEPEVLKKQAHGGCSSGGKQQEWWYSWVSNPPEGGWPTLQEACEEWAVFEYPDFEEREDGALVYSGSHDNKLGQEDVFLKAVAPFVEDTLIECSGEDGCRWAWQIKGGEFKELSGQVVYHG